MKSIERCLHEADAVIIGAGAGLSTAAGLDYSGNNFKQEFKQFIDKYKFTDLYTSSFYPFETENERWAYWAMHVMFARITPHALPLYKKLQQAVASKPYFVITTNVDGQFRKSGFNPEQIFEVQGDYAYIQSKYGTDNRRFYAEDLFRQMQQAIVDCHIPDRLIPYYKNGTIVLGDLSGEPMDINIRKDKHFVQDNDWFSAYDRYRDFINTHCNNKLLLLEIGVGFNTPTIIRFPFEQMAAEFNHATLYRINRDYPLLSFSHIKNFYSATTLSL